MKYFFNFNYLSKQAELSSPIFKMAIIEWMNDSLFTQTKEVRWISYPDPNPSPSPNLDPDPNPDPDPNLNPDPCCE